MARVEEILEKIKKEERLFNIEFEKFKIKVEENSFLISLYKSIKMSKIQSFKIYISHPLRIVVIEKNNYVIVFKYKKPGREKEIIKIYKINKSHIEEISLEGNIIYINSKEAVFGFKILEEIEKLKNIFRAYFFGDSI